MSEKLLKYFNDKVAPIINDIEYKLIEFKFFYKDGEFRLERIETTKSDLVNEMNRRGFRQVILNQYLLRNLTDELTVSEDFNKVVETSTFVMLNYKDEVNIVLNENGTVSVDSANTVLLEIINEKLFNLIK